MKPSTELPASPEAPPRRRSRLLSASIVGLWIVAVLGGACAMLRYDFTVGEDLRAPERWPNASRIPQLPARDTLLVFAHPRCPCTAATLEMLAETMARSAREVEVRTVFLAPPNADPGWTESPTIRQATAIPGVKVIFDNGGREAQLFHATTSGRTLLYNSNGELLFDGGITGSRGHVGENAGMTALATLLSGKSTAHATAPVFGCSILPSAPKCDRTQFPR